MQGVSEPAVAINQQFAKTGSVSVITGLGSAKLSNGEAATLHHNHKSKKSKMDFNSKTSRRTRSVPRPNLIEEDTLFATEARDLKKASVTSEPGAGMAAVTSFAQFPWKSDAAPARNTQDSSSAVFSSFSSAAAMRMRSSLSVSVDEDSRTLAKDEAGLHPDTESSFHSPPRVDFSSSLTRDFSGAFHLQPADPEPPKQRLSFAGALVTQTSASSQQA